MQKILLIALSGAAGTLARYGLSTVAVRISIFRIPAGTMIINIVGCFTFGLLFSIIERYFPVTSDIKFYLLIGFMGAFTTFSAFAYDSLNLFRNGNIFAAFLYIFIQIAAGVIVLFAGIKIAGII